MRIEDLLIRQRQNDKIALKYANKGTSFNAWDNQSSILSRIISSITDDNSKHIGIYLSNSINYTVLKGVKAVCFIR